MASIYKKRKGGPWYIAWYPTPGERRVEKGCMDHKATEARARMLEAEAYNRAKGVIDPTAERIITSETRPITEHLDSFERVMRGRGRTDKHVAQTRRLILAVLDGCGVDRLAVLDAAKVAGFVVDLKERGKSARWINAHLVAMKAFTKWLWRSGLLRSDSMLLVTKLNEKTDRKHQRRALDDDELVWLLQWTADGNVNEAMAGPDRAMLYLLAVETGLRSSELRSLTPESFRLADLGDATVAVLAAYSKHKRDDVLPLRRTAVSALAGWLKGKEAGCRVFSMPPAEHVARMFKADLKSGRDGWLDQAKGKELERRQKTSFLLTPDAGGRVLDFHALRHTFITRLARSGVHPKTAQTLARHSTITLTMDHYTHSLRSDERNALDRLPDLQVQPKRRRRATGTDGGGSASGSAQGA